jgi:translation initiation factor 1 (eIF-1/SUI1)
MEPTLAAALMTSSTQAKIAGAVAARMMQMNQDAAQTLITAMQESSDNLENIAANLASGVGTNVDFSA